MAYDEDLAHRIREQLAGERGITEKAMFGGLAFLLHGHMTVSASGRGGLMLRVDPEATDDALARPHAELVVMRGRPMRGWIRVTPEGVRTKRQLEAWVRRAVQFTRTLPPKG
jgi:TfoX/Sxy family transcriptional regulator of competence genes